MQSEFERTINQEKLTKYTEMTELDGQFSSYDL